MTASTMVTEGWPGWARALLVAQFALILAILLPWILMWSAMAAACMGMGMGGMQQMTPMMPMTPGQ